MTSAVYEWIGLGVGTLAVLVASSALIQEVHGGPDFGSVGFDLVFGIFWAGVAVSCGYSLLHRRRREVRGGCLSIAAVAGAMVLLTGGLLALLSIDGEEPPDRLMVGVMVGLGAVVLL